MSATQIVLIAVAVVIFAAGWMARGRREAHERAAARGDMWLAELDRAIGAALTSFQAVLALWQSNTGGSTDLGARVMQTFQEQRAAVAQVSNRPHIPPLAEEALGKVDAALDRLAGELIPFSQGDALDHDRERLLFRAERELTAARSELLLAAARASGAHARG